MELALSLGDTRNSKSFSFDLDKNGINMVQKDPGFCMGLGHPIKQQDRSNQINIRAGEENTRGSPDEPFQLDFLHLPRPVQRNQPPSELRLFPWLTHNCKEDYCVLSELGSSKGQGRGPEVLKRSEDGASLLSSPNRSTVSSILFQNQMDFLLNRRSKGDLERINSIWANRDQYDTDQRGGAGGGSSSRGSDEDDQNGLTRKKLRLSKQQSAFLQDSFKEQNSLNPKQKLDLAKQLNLRARQVQVWFQNRRARTKLKQTEVDCEYLKRCYETLAEENRRLQKEVQELKVLKTSQAFYNQLLPATTLTMCLSCDRSVASTAAAAAIDTHH